MLVLHAIWDGAALHLWAESSTLLEEAPKPRGRPPKKPRSGPHPFALPGHALGEIVEILFGHQPGAVLQRTFFLPGSRRGPQPSPWLVREGFSERPTDLVRTKVETLAFDLPMAYDLLLDMPPVAPKGLAYSDSLRFWIEAARFTLELLAKEQFAPLVVEDRAVWRAAPDGADMERLDLLSEAMPPGCLALSASSTSPDRLLTSFVDSSVDAFVRQSLVSTTLLPPRRGRPPKVVPLASRFLKALSSVDPRIEGPPEELAAFSGEMENWLSTLNPTPAQSPFRTCFRLDPPTLDGDDRWRLSFFLQARDDLSLLVPAEEVWSSRRGTATFLQRRLKNPHEQLLADLGRASLIYPAIDSSLQEARPSGLDLDSEEAYTFLRQSATLLEESGFGVLLPTWWERPKARMGLRLRLSPPPVDGVTSGLFGEKAVVAYDWELALGDSTVSQEEFEELIKLKVPLVKVRGEWVGLRAEDVESAIEFFERRRNQGEIGLGQAIRMGLGAGNGGGIEVGGLPVLDVEANGWVKDMLEGLNGAGDGKMGQIEPPLAFEGTLRPYQVKGVSWLSYLEGFGLGACLADDMGLGKTVELIAFLLHEREAGKGRLEGRLAGRGIGAGMGGDVGSEMGREIGREIGREMGREIGGEMAGEMPGEVAAGGGSAPGTGGDGPGPTLLVSPMSVVGNWQRELQRFAPSLRVHVHHGADRLSGREFAASALEHDVVLTTYALAHRDVEALSAVPWRHVVLDEAQNIKNPGAKQTRAIKMIRAENRIAMTGTPVENRLSELWSIMDFLNPGYLGSAKAFRREFALPIERYRDGMRGDLLRRMIQPFVLRRLKTDRSIIKDLPEKVEARVYYHLTREQASLYSAVVEDMISRIEGSEGIERKGLVLAALTKLKQVCNHPALLLQDGSPLEGRSGKLQRLDGMLEEVLAAGEKALIFTQFAGMGAMLQHHIQERLGCQTLFLHGKTTKRAREKMIETFQSDGPPVFILSLKAGGFGLNLTAANHVFHFDRWWNPAVEDQATDRVFRIGQHKNVFCHKFVCIGTLEERIDQMIEMKKELADSVVGSGEAWLTEMSTEELREVLLLSRDAVALGDG